MTPARVRVPGSSSNLGAGFDCVGMAVDRFLEAEWEPSSGPLEVLRGDEETPPPGEDLVAVAFERSLAARGLPAEGRIHVRSDIPVARGLGSSAAAYVAGWALAGLVAGEALDPDAAFAAGTLEEGHGDNAGPSAYGGLIAVVGDAAHARAVRLDLSPAVGFAFAAPPTRVSTRAARAALPATVPHALAADALRRMAALLRGLATADPDLLRLGFDDALHVPHRLPLIPGAEEAIAAATEAGAWGVTVSGSGSGLLAVGPPELSPSVAAAMARTFAARHGEGVEAFPVRCVLGGVASPAAAGR